MKGFKVKDGFYNNNNENKKGCDEHFRSMAQRKHLIPDRN